MGPLTGLKQHPCWVTEQGSGESVQIDTKKDSQVNNGNCFVPWRAMLKSKLKKYKSKL